MILRPYIKDKIDRVPVTGSPDESRTAFWNDFCNETTLFQYTTSIKGQSPQYWSQRPRLIGGGDYNKQWILSFPNQVSKWKYQPWLWYANQNNNKQKQICQNKKRCKSLCFGPCCTIRTGQHLKTNQSTFTLHFLLLYWLRLQSVVEYMYP